MKTSVYQQTIAPGNNNNTVANRIKKKSILADLVARYFNEFMYKTQIRIIKYIKPHLNNCLKHLNLNTYRYNNKQDYTEYHVYKGNKNSYFAILEWSPIPIWKQINFMEP